MICLVFIITSCTHIHRYLIDDEAEHRTWCVVKYSPSLQTFDWVVNILHFSFPFAINCISALVIITATARMRSNVRKKQSYKEHLRIQFREHKHLLISPCILVLLALPRLIISFLSGCMKSARNPWLYLIGYFISFVPTIMTFIVFVLPSEMYRKEFRDSMKRFYLSNACCILLLDD
jgi:hypothetical protein